MSGFNQRAPIAPTFAPYQKSVQPPVPIQVGHPAQYAQHALQTSYGYQTAGPQAIRGVHQPMPLPVMNQQPRGAASRPTSAATHPVSLHWIRAVAEGAIKMDGTALATCVDDSQLPNFLQIPLNVRNILASGVNIQQKKTTAANEVITFITWLRGAIHAEIDTKASQLKESEEAINGAKRHSELFVNMAAAVFVLHVTRLLQPAAVEGDRKNAHIYHRRPTRGGIVDHTDLTAIMDGCTSETRNVYLRGLLAAFDCLQEEHTKRRDSKLFKGFPGWDTAVVISFVHIVQNVAQTIEVLEDSIMGDILRNWRKLFVFLQTSDIDVANDVSRRRGTLAVANSLLILLFQHDNTHQCRILLKTIETAEKSLEVQKDATKSIIASSSHLVAEMVKFRYFQGRIRLYDRNYVGALASFAEASRLLPPLSIGSFSNGTNALANKHSPGPEEMLGKKNPKLEPTSAVEGTDHSLAWGVLVGGVVVSPSLPAPIPLGMNEAQRDNKLRVVFYQVVSAILCGVRVPMSVLYTDPTAAKVFVPIIAALQSGSPQGFSTALDRGGAYLRLRGVFMLLQQARIFAYLTVLQQLHAAIASSGNDSSMVPIPLVVSAINAADQACCDPSSPGYLFPGDNEESEATTAKVVGNSNSSPVKLSASKEYEEHSDVYRLVKKLRTEMAGPIELDDTVLWVARLVARGLVRGYVSYEHKMLVLSKKDPFPIPNYEFVL